MMPSVLLGAVLASAPIETIDFDSAVARALSSNPSMRMARDDRDRALAQLEQARAPSLPTLTGTATLQLLDHDRLLNGNVFLAQEQAFGNLQLNVPVLNTPRWGQWYRASKSADAAKASADDVRRQVAVLAARTWLALLAQTRVVAAAQTARDAAQGHLAYAKDRFSGGVGNRLDELRAAQELGASQAQLESALGTLVRLEEALGVVVGADSPLEVPQVEPTLTSPATLDESLAGAGEARLDVKAAKVREEAARSAAQTDWLDYLPLVNAVFQPFFQAPPTATTPATGWQGQLVLSLPLYDGSLRYGQAHERDALASQAAAQLEAVLRQARSDVRAAFEQVRHADASATAARQAAKDAAEALELANVAYHSGVSTNLEVIDAERRSRDALVQSALADDAARQARLDLLVASGRFPGE